MTTRRPTTARLLAGLAPFLLVGLSLPLLAPSCGDFTPGVKTFAKGSLVIPMDVCYQCTRQSADGLDTATASCTKTGYVSPSGNACPQALSQGDVIKAYGLVYQLIRNDVAVYWVIDSQKQAVDGYDLAIQYAGGFPVLKLDWATGQPGGAPTTAPGGVIHYMGGPFVVDGSDAAKAIAVMKANQATFGSVNVHVSNVAFQGNVAKTMAGGWTAGGAVPPKLALLNIGSGNLSTRSTAPSSTCDTSGSATCVKDAAGASWTCIGSAKNAEPVIEGYLAKAGIGSGTAGGSSTGVHGEIYDRLTLADFIPSTPGDWKTTTLYKNGYQVLWVPHWVAPGSCTAAANSAGDIGACACLNSQATPAQVAAVLQTIGKFNQAGKDVFAECAGLGSFEGAFSGLTGTGYTFDYRAGDPSTRFQTKTGVRYNQLPNNPFPTPSLKPDNVANFASPLMQVGDYPFKPYTGAIEDYKPDDTSNPDRNYQPGVTRLIGVNYTSGSPATARDWDFFTFRDKAADHGSIVYLAGHSYSGVQGSFQVAGSRLVINTLFNLGATCTASGVACDTGLLGACSRGVLTCDASGNRVCTPTATPQPEICNGIDDNCNGLVDENLEKGCYDGPPSSLDGAGQPRGACRSGVQMCQQNADGSYGYSSCQGEVLPTAEICNGVDDDCDGLVDQIAAGVPISVSCYSGPTGTAGVGACRAGTSTCTNGLPGTCVGEVTPSADPCHSPEYNPSVGGDLDCNGVIDQCNEACTAGATRDCFDGPTSAVIKTPTNGSLCQRGLQTCGLDGQWQTACAGEVLPGKEVCRNGVDENCNGLQDDLPPYCMSCQFVADPTDHSKPDLSKTEKLPCWTGPSDAIFNSAATPSSVCVQGFQFCQASGQFGACEQQTLPGPELCNGRDDNCNGTVDEGAQCGSGFACQNGVCVEAACDGVEHLCRVGYYCVQGLVPGDPGAGRCIVDACGTGGACASGTACNGASCVDPCAPGTITCGPGSTCAGGACTGGACYAVGCPDGQLCQNGSCQPDPCASVICPAGTFCRQGDCVQACAFVTCGPSEKCSLDGFCVADPCAGKTCGASQACVDGTCRTDACLGIACDAHGQACLGGVCVDDPCAGVTCPTGQCRDGQCFATHAVSSTTPGTSPSSGGCGCGGGAGSPLALLGLLLALPLARRRRGGRGAAALALLAVAGLATAGCTKATSAPFDPSSCALLTPPQTTCESEERCVDTYTDPSHCGTCGQACGAGNRCVDGVCGPSSLVAPWLRSVTPETAFVEGLAPTQLVLSGDRLAAGATLRATGPGGTITIPTVLADGTLKALLDLTAAPPGAWKLRVVSQDLVISNALPFGVTIATPTISKVLPIPDASPGSTPARVSAGVPFTLRLEGSHFMGTSACRISGTTLPEQDVPSRLTAIGSGAAAEVVLDCSVALAVPPGTYQVRVLNDASHASAPAAWEVVSAVPRLDSIAPSSVRPGSTPVVQLFGSNYDATSKVWFRGPGFSTSVNTDLLTTNQLRVPVLDLQHCPSAPCPATNAATSIQYFLQVRNGALASAEQELVIEASARTVTDLSPLSLWQGDTGEAARVSILGQGLTGTTALEFAHPGMAFQAATSLQVADTAVSGVVDLVGTPPGSAPAGSWNVRLRFPNGAVSPSFTLRIDSNQAVITATPEPAGGPAGSTVGVTLTVSNLRPPSSGVRVRFYDPAPGATFSTDLTPASFSPGGKALVWVPLAGLETKVYAIAVRNPNGAAESSPYNFTVLPGQPTVTAVACTNVTGGPPGCTSASSAALQEAPVPVQITGTNFAKPDPAGNNGSQVRISSPALGVTDYLVPPTAVTVVSATRIDVLLDTRLALPGTYAISIWNQGGALQSAALPNAFTILQ